MVDNFNSNYILNFGPQHPAAHGVLRLLIELNGERILSLDPHIGFLHRGTEKLIEYKTYMQSIPYFDRLDYVSMLTQEHGFVLAVESLLNISVTKRVMYIRVLFDELTRILNHIMCLTTHALDVGALTPFLWGFEEREKIMVFYEKISGSRMHAAYYRVGGVFQDLPDNILNEIYLFSNNFLTYISVLEDILAKNPIWLSRLSNIGFISKKDSLDFSLSGPVIRGSGIPWDSRKTQPYEVYSNLKFNIPVSDKGDSFSRFYVRLFEMKESIFIIQQCLEFLSSDFNKYSDYTNNNFYNLFKFSDKNSSKSSMEELIFHFKLFSEGFLVPKGTVYNVIEAPKGETGVFLTSDGSNKPLRCKIKAPGFLHLQVLNHISKNLLLADIVTIIGSLDIVFGEIDR